MPSSDLRICGRSSLAALSLFGLVASAGCGLPYPDLPADGSPGIWSASFDHNEVLRSAIVYVPDELMEPAPMLLNFHGYGGTAPEFMADADLRDVADDAGFILVYPQGTRMEGSPHWNSAAPSDNNKSNADDFGFVAQLIDTIADAYNVDTDRVYAAGYSNGGMMAFGLACYRGDLVAAVASISGALLDDIGVSCTPTTPTSVLTMHGTADTVLPYDGAEGMRSAQGALDFWTDVNGITDAPLETSSNDGGTSVETLRYTGGTNGTEVLHHRVVGGGHVWFDLEVDETPTNQMLWQFLSRFELDGAL